MNMSSIMWVETYRPQKIADVVGNEKAKSQFLEWLRKWKPGNKAALLYGSPGIGKTTLVKVAARELGYSLVEMNASDFRTEEKVMRIAGRAATERSLVGIFSDTKGTIIFLDEVDGIFGREDQGGIAAVLKVAKSSNSPVVLVANNPWDPRLRYMRFACEMIRFYGIRMPTIVAYLKKIAKNEGIEVEDEALRIIAERAEGDLRSAINDFQSLAERRRMLRASDVESMAQRDRQYNVFDTLKDFFSAKTSLHAKRALDSSEVDFDILFLTIHDNLPAQFQDLEKMAIVYDAMSKADVIMGRIKRSQNWGLMPYVIDLVSTGVMLAEEEYHYVKYQFPPTKVAMLGRNKGERTMREEVCTHIGAKCHVSRKIANLDFIPFLRLIFENDKKLASSLSHWFNFNEKMIEFLAGSEKLAKAIVKS